MAKQGAISKVRQRLHLGAPLAPAAPPSPADQWTAAARQVAEQAWDGAVAPLPLAPALALADAARSAAHAEDRPVDVTSPDCTIVLLLGQRENAPMVLREIVRDLRLPLTGGMVVDVVAVLRGFTPDKAAAVAHRYATDPQVRLMVANASVTDAACLSAAAELVRAPYVVVAQGLSAEVSGEWLPHLLRPLREGIPGDPAVPAEAVRIVEPSIRVAKDRARSVPPPEPAAVVAAMRTEEVRAVVSSSQPADGSAERLAELALRLRARYGGGPAVADLTVMARAFAIPPAPVARPVRRARVTPAGETALPAEVPNLTWAIWTPVPYGRSRFRWGDYYFALSLAAALRRLGQDVAVDYVESVHRATVRSTDVVLALRGLQRWALPPERAVAMQWVFSHPGDVATAELDGWDVVYAAGEAWAAEAASRSGRPVETLLQATDAGLFHPGVAPATSGPAVGATALFVGNARGLRPVVRDALAGGLGDGRLAVVGRDWPAVLPDGVPPESVLRGESLANADLPAAYAAAHVVLADHEEGMRVAGFLNNRLFDAAATGARVVADATPEALDDLFGGLVRPYSSPEELAALVSTDDGWPDPSAAQAAAARVVAEHSFDARARRLVADAVAARTALG